MPYQYNTIIARPVRNGLDGFWDTIKDIGSGIKDIYNQGQQAQGASAVLTAQQQAAAAAAAAGNGIVPGISNTTLMVGGAALIGVMLIVTRKKDKTA